MKPGRCKKPLPDHNACGLDVDHDGDCGAPWRPWKRGLYLPAPHSMLLDQACLPLVSAFGHCIYLVGSALVRRDYRDVDVRCILQDAHFRRLFPLGGELDPLWSLMCTAFSLQLSQATGLPIDFQIQAQSEANSRHEGHRSALGMFRDYPGEPAAAEARR